MELLEYRQNNRSEVKCRVCLDEFDDSEMIDLFNENGNSGGQKLSEKVAHCCGVRIRDSPEMPRKICLKCFDVTRIWYNFRQMCLNSQVYLESMCKDRDRPNAADGVDDDGVDDDGDYLEYLLMDLQTSRGVQSYAYDSDSDRSEAHAREAPLTESDDDYLVYDATDSDLDLQDIMKNIKKEKTHEEADEKAIKTQRKAHLHNTRQRIAKGVDGRGRKGAETKRQYQTAKRAANQPKKTGGFITKRQYRPSSPTSYMCSICGNVYSKKASFNYHMNLHSNVKPHECELCGKNFRQVGELKCHMRRHTGEKPFKCTYCDRHFIDRSERHRHERVHTNTRPYTCNICGKSFTYSAILKNHSKLHSGEKDFNCLVCQKAFTLQHQLKAHLQTITHKQKESQLVTAGYEVVYE